MTSLCNKLDQKPAVKPVPKSGSKTSSKPVDPSQNPSSSCPQLTVEEPTSTTSSNEDDNFRDQVNNQFCLWLFIFHFLCSSVPRFVTLYLCMLICTYVLLLCTNVCSSVPRFVTLYLCMLICTYVLLLCTNVCYSVTMYAT